MKWGCRGHWGHWGCWGCRGQWGCKGSMAWKITTDDCRVIQVPEFSFILMFWKQIFFVTIMKYQVEFWHLLSWRLLRPAYVNFLKNGGWNSNFQLSWDLSTPQSHLVFQYDTPCTSMFFLMINLKFQSLTDSSSQPLQVSFSCLGTKKQSGKLILL